MRCAFPSRFPSTTRQHKVHRLRCIAERLGHGVHVRVHREPDCGVPEDCLNGFRINASGHKKGRSRVAQVMEPYFLIGEAGQFVCLAHLRVLGDQWRRPALGPDAYRHPPFPTGAPALGRRQLQSELIAGSGRNRGGLLGDASDQRLRACKNLISGGSPCQNDSDNVCFSGHEMRRFRAWTGALYSSRRKDQGEGFVE